MGDYYDNSFGYIRLGSRTYGKTEQMIKEAYERGKKEEREQCCLDVCEWCRRERPFLPDTFVWHVPFVEGSGPLECRAYPIRRRAGQ